MEDAPSGRTSGANLGKHGSLKEVIEEKAEEYDEDEEE